MRKTINLLTLLFLKIESGKEIMSEDYLELLEIERDYINARFISKRLATYV